MPKKVSKKYFKGYKLERKVKDMLERDGWYVIRSAGSKKPDLIAAKDGKVVVIECKSTSKQTLYLDKKEVKNLIDVSKHFNAQPMYAVKYARKIYFFFMEEIKEKEKSYVIEIEKI